MNHYAQYRECDDPAGGVGDIQTLDGVNFCKYCVNPKNPQSASAHQGYEHRCEGITQSSHSGCAAVHKSQQEIGKTHIYQPYNAEVDSFCRIGDEQRKQRLAKNKEGQADCNDHWGHTTQTGVVDFLHPIEIVSAGILSHIICGSGGESAGDSVCHSLQGARSAVTRDQRFGVKGVDSGCDDNVGQCK